MLTALCSLNAKIEVPEIIDMGNVMVSGYEDTTHHKGEVLASKFFTIKNNTSNEYYFSKYYGLKHDNLPYIGVGGSAEKIRKFDSITQFFHVYIPLNNLENLYDSTLYLKFWILYRELNSFDNDSILATVKIKIVRAKGYVFDTHPEKVYYMPDSEYYKKDVMITLGTLKNYKEGYRIDSIKISSDKNEVIQSDYGFPYSHKLYEELWCGTRVNITECVDTKFKVEVYGKFMLSQVHQKFTFETVYKFKLLTDYVKPYGSTAFAYTLTIPKNTKEWKMYQGSPFSLANYTQKNYELHKIELIADYPDYVKTDFNYLPLPLPKPRNDIGHFTIIDVGTISISTPDDGNFKNKVMIKFFLRDENGYEQAESVCIKYQANPLLSIIENDISNIEIAPNPANDYITINLLSINPTLKRGIEDKSFIEIYDVMGLKIQSTPSAWQPSINEGNLKIDISNLAPGIYFVKIGGRVEKFVKM